MVYHFCISYVNICKFDGGKMISWTLSAEQHSHKVEHKHDLTTFLLVAISHYVTCSEISPRMIEISKCMMDFYDNILVTDLSFL